MPRRFSRRGQKRFHHKASRRPFKKRRFRDIRFSRRNPAYRAWKHAVHRRDNYTCMLCGKQQKRFLHAHHIVRKADNQELAFDVSNGVSLCKHCHNRLVDRREEVFAPLLRDAIEARTPLGSAFRMWFDFVLLDFEAAPCGCGCGEMTKFRKNGKSKYLTGHRPPKKSKYRPMNPSNPMRTTPGDLIKGEVGSGTVHTRATGENVQCLN